MPELRKEPISGRWINFSFEKEEKPIFTEVKKTETSCIFCEGREKETEQEIISYREKNTSPNSPGWWIRVIPLKFASLQIEGKIQRTGEGIYDLMDAVGAYEIVIETPKHNEDLHDLSLEHIEKIFLAYKDRISDLKKDKRFKYIFVFKNHRPEKEGILSHSYSSILATPIVPKRIKEEFQGAKQYYEYKERCIWCDIIRQELSTKKRIVYESENFICLCPFASKFPYEMLVIPSLHSSDFIKIQERDIIDLSKVVKISLQKMNKLLGNIPYNYILHSAPNPIPREGYWKTIEEDYHWHLEIAPQIYEPYGFEWGSGFYINRTTAESAAKYLREINV